MEVPVESSSTLTEVATVLTAVFTACAAAVAAYAAKAAARSADASDRSIELTRLVFDRSQRADLALQVITDRDEGRTELVFVNVGRGVAKAVAYMVVAAQHRAVEYVEDGFLRPGEKVRVGGAIPLDDDARGIVVWLDADNTGWALSRDGRRVRLGRGHEWTGREADEWDATPGEVWRQVFGDSDDLDATVRIPRSALSVTIERAANPA